MNDQEGNQTNNNINELRADVAATTDVLKVTVEKLVQRGDNLDALNNRAETLNSTSYHFRGAARRVNRRMRWQNYKLTIFMIFVVLCIIGFIILMALHPWKK
ncbi:unnamed protein product [Rotaria sp. Silwood1]|nr:unnamed protein product [Rotaria sp. Silwood1]CAF1217264.1 unnamed protein product [Rotaria sp. Silwood1]CAF1220469.1 unnamed protein product [Rotaria sp. Silwood1]CAF3482524.1 unnamed protein product [Rotaria sp. Silwood1]CAF3491580.1 unnamed protein product [Rotaria sp. Silwood1]